MEGDLGKNLSNKRLYWSELQRVQGTGWNSKGQKGKIKMEEW